MSGKYTIHPEIARRILRLETIVGKAGSPEADDALGRLRRELKEREGEMKMKKGLYDKYKIAKTDGTPIDPDAHYFVLNLSTDQDAREAAYEYADLCAITNPKLSEDLKALLAALEGKPPQTGPQGD